MSDTHITGGLTPAEWVNWRHPMNGRDAAVSDDSTIQPTVPPALTPEEWHKVRSHDHAMANSLLAWEPEDMPAVMAIANAAMFSDDPRKITRAMVTAMTQAAHYIENANGRLSTAWPTGGNPWHKLAADLRDHATALAAILPRE
jgi:hypothetical protein